MRRFVVAFACALCIGLVFAVSARSHVPPAPRVVVPPAAAPTSTARSASRLAAGRAVVTAAWGGGATEFGRKHEEESNPEGPMAIVARGGDVWVLDQVNHRVQRYRGGTLVATIEIGTDTAQDIAPLRGGGVALLDRLAERNVQVYGPDGKPTNQIALADGGDATGVFADDRGIYIERDHQSLARIATADGTATTDRDELAGRPSRDGRRTLQVAIENPAGELLVRANDRATGDQVWSRRLWTDGMIMQVVMLDSDAAGNVYVGVEVGRENVAPPFELSDVHTWVARIDAAGAWRGELMLPALGPIDETLRPMTVDDRGVLYLMTSDASLQVRSYTFP